MSGCPHAVLGGANALALEAWSAWAWSGVAGLQPASMAMTPAERTPIGATNRVLMAVSCTSANGRDQWAATRQVLARIEPVYDWVAYLSPARQAIGSNSAVLW